MLSEDRGGEGLAAGLSVADNLTRIAPQRVSGPGVRGAAVAAGCGRRRAGSIGWRFGARARGRRSRELSGGNQQKVAVARLLHHDVDVLVLDEPTRGIDVGEQGARSTDLIDESGVGRQIATSEEPYRSSAAICRSSSACCDRIAVMSRGRLGPARPVEEWTEHSLLMDASGARARS